MLLPYVMIDWQGAPCANKCKHCYANAGDRRVTKVSYERARDITKKFSAWASQFDKPGSHVGFSISYSCEIGLPTLLDSIRFRREHGMQGWDYLNMNGLAFRTRTELEDMYGALKDVGARLVNLSFHGYGEAHDEYAGRKGEFDYLLLMAEVIADLGLKRSETILLRKSTLPDLPRLLGKLDSIPGLEQRISNLIDYLGRGVDVDDERLEMHDLDALPEGLRKGINLNNYRTEAAWVDAAIRGDLPPKTAITYFISVREDNINYLENTDCDDILKNIREQDEARCANEPSFADLARAYGDPTSQKLYRLRDLEHKWPASFWKEKDPNIYEQFIGLKDSWVRIS